MSVNPTASLTSPIHPRLVTLNRLCPEDFIREAGPFFEHSPWIAERAAPHRPFFSPESLHDRLMAIVSDASPEEQLTLIRAHPDLAGKLAISGALTPHSTAEQQSAHLDRLTPGQFQRMSRWNDQYRSQFGFPFVICVRDHSQEQVFEAFQQRLNHDRATEIQTALDQIGRIAWHRLVSWMTVA